MLRVLGALIQSAIEDKGRIGGDSVQFLLRLLARDTRDNHRRCGKEGKELGDKFVNIQLLGRFANLSLQIVVLFPPIKSENDRSATLSL